LAEQAIKNGTHENGYLKATSGTSVHFCNYLQKSGYFLWHLLTVVRQYRLDPANGSEGRSRERDGGGKTCEN
jgi:hypothetical protein